MIKSFSSSYVGVTNPSAIWVRQIWITQWPWDLQDCSPNTLTFHYKCKMHYGQNVHIISYHATGPSPRKFKSTQGQHNWPAIAKNLWVEDAGCHICLQMLGKFLSELGGVGFEVSETYKLLSGSESSFLSFQLSLLLYSFIKQDLGTKNSSQTISKRTQP